jgi:hypothetical protein
VDVVLVVDVEAKRKDFNLFSILELSDRVLTFGF